MNEENLSLSYTEDTLTATLRGEIDHHSAIRVRTQIDDALDLNRPEKLIIDVGNVDFMDSSGLGLIMGRYAKAKELNIALIVRNPSPRAKKMLVLAGLEKIIEIEESEEI